MTVETTHGVTFIPRKRLEHDNEICYTITLRGRLISGFIVRQARKTKGAFVAYPRGGEKKIVHSLDEAAELVILFDQMKRQAQLQGEHITDETSENENSDMKTGPGQAVKNIWRSLLRWIKSSPES